MGLKSEFLVLLPNSTIKIKAITTRGELKSERPDGFFVIDIMRLTEDAPEVGELEAWELTRYEIVSLGLTNKRIGVGIIAENTIHFLQIRRKKVVSLDDDTVSTRANYSVSFGGMLNNGNVAGRIGD